VKEFERRIPIAGAHRGHVEHLADVCTTAKSFRPLPACCGPCRDQLDFRGLHDREVSRLLAFKNTATIYASLTIGIRGTACVAHQTASYDRCARLEDRRHPVVKRQCSELFLACNEEDVVDYDEPANPQWD
jgi:hypothetical protein